MHAKCSSCNTHWNISIYAIIPRSGYLCPVCRKKKEERIENNGKQERGQNNGITSRTTNRKQEITRR